MQNIQFRNASPDDIDTILMLIRELAAFERLSDQVTVDAAILEEWLFRKNAAEVILAESEGKAVAYALFFSSFSTFLGKAGLYLEDLFVLPEYRKQGIGKSLFLHLLNLAKTRGYGRMEWSCLDWNENALAFYRKLGAEPLSDWTVQRITL